MVWHRKLIEFKSVFQISEWDVYMCDEYSVLVSNTSSAWIIFPYSNLIMGKSDV